MHPWCKTRCCCFRSAPNCESGLAPLAGDLEHLLLLLAPLSLTILSGEVLAWYRHDLAALRHTSPPSSLPDQLLEDNRSTFELRALPLFLLASKNVAPDDRVIPRGPLAPGHQQSHAHEEEEEDHDHERERPDPVAERPPQRLDQADEHDDAHARLEGARCGQPQPCARPARVAPE